MSIQQRAPHSPPLETGPDNIPQPLPESRALPLRLRLVSGYLNFTGVLGFMVSVGVTAFQYLSSAPLVSATGARLASGLLVSLSSVYAARSLRRREKQGARVALGLFAAPFLYALLGRSEQGGFGLYAVLGIIAIITAWKELE